MTPRSLPGAILPRRCLACQDDDIVGPVGLPACPAGDRVRRGWVGAVVPPRPVPTGARKSRVVGLGMEEAWH
jgi:hypothetical protein